MRLRIIDRGMRIAVAVLATCSIAKAGGDFRNFVVEGGIAGAERVELRVVNINGEVMDGATLYSKEDRIEGTLPIPLGEQVEIRLEAYDYKARLISSGRSSAKFGDLRSGLSTVEAVTKNKERRGELTVTPLKLQIAAEKIDDATQRFYLSAVDAYGQQAFVEDGDVMWDIPFPSGATSFPCKSGGNGIACIEVHIPVRLSPAVVACKRDLKCIASLQSIPIPIGYRSIAAGIEHTCALTVDQRVLCFGSNANGELGRPTTKTCRTSTIPAQAGVFKCDPTPAEVVCSSGQNCKFIAIDAGRQHTCAIDTDNNVSCWGNNSHEQLGYRCAIGTTGPNCTSSAMPVRINFPSMPGDLFPKFSQVATGDSHSCAISQRGNLFCWGSNGQSQSGGPSSLTAPHRLTSNEVYVQVAAGLNHSCAVTMNGDLDCWGGNSHAQIRPIPIQNNIFHDPTPVRGFHPSLVGAITRVTASDFHTCAQDSQSGTVCWGGTQSNDVIVSSNAATNIELGHQSAVFNTPSCAIAGGVVSCANALSTLLSVVGAPDRLIDVAAGTSHTCAVRDNGEAFCWGPENRAGQMGDGTTAAHGLPARVLGP